MSGTTSGGPTWSANFLTFSYADSAPADLSPNFNTTSLTTAEQQIFSQAFAAYTAAANLSFWQMADSTTSDLRIGFGTPADGSTDSVVASVNAAGTSFKPDTEIVLLDPTAGKLGTDANGVLAYNPDTAQEVTFYQVALQAIGKALGLPADTTASSILASLSAQNTTLSAADVAAVQQIYGASSGTTVGGLLPAITVPVSGTNFTQNGSTITISSDASQVATVNLTGTPTSGGQFTLNGGAAALNFTGNNTELNLQNQTGAVTITSTGTGNNTVHAGAAPITYVSGGNSVIQLGTTGTAASLSLTGGTSTDSNTVVASGAAGTTATITNNSAGYTTVFASAQNVDYTGGNAQLVLSSDAGSGSANVTSTGNVFVWAGTGAVNFNATAGSAQIVLGNTAGVSSSLNLTSTSSATSVEVDTWGSLGTTTTINNTGAAPVSLFSGPGGFDYTGGNATIAFADSSGGATVTSTGNNVLWAGQPAVTFVEGTGSDQLIAGSGVLTVQGDTNAADAGGTTKIIALGNASGGTIDYSGGVKGAFVQFASTANETLNFIGGSGASTLQLAAGSSNISAGSGALNLTTGSGALNLTAGSGALSVDLAGAMKASLTFSGNSGAADIYNFNASRDSITFASGSVTSTVAGSNGLTVTLGDGNHVVVHGASNLNGLTFS